MSEANKKQVGGQHYKGGIDHWDFCIANDVPYMEAQIIKYVVRHRKKNGLQDLEKAQHFLEKLIEVEQMKKSGRVMRVIQVQDDSTTNCRRCARWLSAEQVQMESHRFTEDRRYCAEYKCFTDGEAMKNCDRFEAK